MLHTFTTLTIILGLRKIATYQWACFGLAVKFAAVIASRRKIPLATLDRQLRAAAARDGVQLLGA